MKECNNDENLNEIIISASSNEENFFEFLKEVNNNYEIKKFINKSNISKIYQAKNIKENKNVSLKVIEKKKLNNNYDLFMKQIQREEEILNLLKLYVTDTSDNIIHLYQTIETENYIILNSNFVEKIYLHLLKKKALLKKILYYLKIY